MLRRVPCLFQCSAVLKFLIIFGQGFSRFHFALGPANSVTPCVHTHVKLRIVDNNADLQGGFSLVGEIRS